MFKKLKFEFPNHIIKKCEYVTKNIDRCVVLDHNHLSAYKFIDYAPDSEEAYVIKKYNEKFSISKNSTYDHKIIDFPWKKIIDFLPETILQQEIPVVRWQKFGANSIIAPHVDLDRFCTINLYLSVNNEQTIFYNKKRSGIQLQTISGGVTNENYIDEWLEEYDSFVAKKFDTYLLNVQHPHSVIGTTNCDRISLQFSFKKTPFETIVNLID